MAPIRRSATSAALAIFKVCERHPQPHRAFSRACSKVGHLARCGRPVLHHLESALSEQTHMLLMIAFGYPERALEHGNARDEQLAMYRRAASREHRAG